jgi:hypothetical protein
MYIHRLRLGVMKSSECHDDCGRYIATLHINLPGHSRDNVGKDEAGELRLKYSDHDETEGTEHSGAEEENDDPGDVEDYKSGDGDGDNEAQEGEGEEGEKRAITGSVCSLIRRLMRTRREAWTRKLANSVEQKKARGKRNKRPIRV